jgi:rhodanese-related sulfurtransferase
MPSVTTITSTQLSRLIGLPHGPALVDVRIDDDYRADPRLLPGSLRHDFRTVEKWAPQFLGKSVVVVCHKGQKLSEGAAAWLRHGGIDAQNLEGGFEAWKKAGELLVRTDKLPPRDDKGRTVWVTRTRPKVDRIACPWLIRRFIDPNAVFLFVQPAEVPAVAERFNATPFDIEGVFWSHRGETCTFDTMIEEFGLKSDALLQLAKIVRGADTARPDLTPQSEGLLAASLGYSRMYRDDLPQLEAAMTFYDAFYRWCRDAKEETHNWPCTKPKA